MVVEVDLDRRLVSLEQRDDFGRLSVAARGAEPSVAAVVELLGDAARAEGEDVWLRATALEALAAPDTDWTRSFRAMLDAVRRFGWYDAERDEVKLHVEWHAQSRDAD